MATQIKADRIVNSNNQEFAFEYEGVPEDGQGLVWNDTKKLFVNAIISTNTFVDATGGDVFEADGFRYHVYKTVGNSNSIDIIRPGIVEYLVIGGGGGGGGRAGAGGGAGGVLYGAFDADATSYPVVVGNYGSGGPTNTYGGDGQPSSVFGFEAFGGGGAPGGNCIEDGRPGGSGSGGSYGGKGGSGTDSQGYAGGYSGGHCTNGIYPYKNGGGGGGAGPGGAADMNSGQPGFGGIGTLAFSDWAIATSTGVSQGYAGGGGGGGHRPWNGKRGTATHGGGSSGTLTWSNGVAGQANTGGGGGGACSDGSGTNSGGNGGSGIVIIRYPIQEFPAFAGKVHEAGGYRYHTFTHSGDFVLPAQAKTLTIRAIGGGGGGGTGCGMWAMGGGGGGYAEVTYDAGPGIYRVNVGKLGIAQEFCNNNYRGTNGGASSFEDITNSVNVVTANGGVGGGQFGDTTASGGSSTTSGATSVISTKNGGSGNVGTTDGHSGGGSNGYGSTYGSGAAGVNNGTPGAHASGYGNGGSGGNSCQGSDYVGPSSPSTNGHRGGGNGSQGIVIVSYAI